MNLLQMTLDIKSNSNGINLLCRVKQCEMFLDMSILITFKNSILSFLGVGYTCEDCERMYTSLNFLQRHNRYYCSSRTITKICECKLCGKKFTSLYDLNNHTSTHADEKQYQSKRCNKTLTQSTHRNKIFRTQPGEKPYQCPQCNKAFNKSSSLATHLRSYQCR